MAFIEIENKSYTIALPSDSSVYDAMIQLQKNSGFTFQGYESSGIGFFVETIQILNENKSRVKLANVKTEFLKVFKL
jgi:hypothetical protein